MQFTKHAAVRCQQRGIPEHYIDIIMAYGTPTRKPGNALEYKLDRKTRDRIIRDLKHLMILVDKCTRAAVLVDGDHDQIITVYHPK